MSRLNQFFLNLWQGRSLGVQLLRPAAALYGFLLRRKALAFRSSAAWPAHVRPPIIVVGNVVTGGVGKTPVLLQLLAHLQSLGYRPGVVSRGYGRSRHAPAILAVHANTPAAQAGDEPLLIAQKTGLPVFVGAQRLAAAQALCAAHPEVDVLLSDDGLQHWALPRELEIIVWDARGLGNGYLLPAGMLREPWPRQPWHPYAAMAPQALHLYAGQEPPAALAGQAAWRVQRSLADYSVQADGQCLSMAQWQGRPVAALAGIAQPQVFFQALRDQGLHLTQALALPDHADLGAWWHSLDARARAQTWFCTEKDAVKLWPLCPQAQAVPLQIGLPAGFYSALAEALAAHQSFRRKLHALV